jgi:hypothetical protein
MASNQYSFQSKEWADWFLQRWVRIVSIGVLGALVGLLLSLILPPRYEAVASMLINYDYTYTSEGDLLIEDRVLDRVYHLFVSDETYSNVLDQLVATEGTLDAWKSVEVLRGHTRMDARLSRWEFIGIHTEPEIAVLIANTWQQEALGRLDEAMDHAWKAQSLPGFSFDVACVETIIVENWDDVISCVATGEELSQETIDELRKELAASHGILPMIAYEPFQEANLPERPVLWPRGVLILSGGVIGFILGFLIIILPKELWKKINSEAVD